MKNEQIPNTKEKQINKKEQSSRRRKRIIGAVLLVAGLAVFFYPSLGNIISYFQQISVVAEYEQQVAKLTNKEVRLQKELAAEYKRTLASAEKAAQIGAIDAVIAAGETRQAIVDALDLLEGKRVSNLPKKHSNIPF